MIEQSNICSRCVMDETVPEIEFDKDNVCNYCKLHNALDRDFPNDEKGTEILNNIIKDIKKVGKNRRYDCVIGVSGGTDSTYLVHFAKERGLRPLAVHLDNGWNSEISVHNIKSCLEKLDVDLYTHVINWDEMKDILVSALKSSIPWVDGPTDIAILAILYKIAAKENIKYIFVGNNFRTEGRQPTEWTNFDGRMLKYIQKKFGTHRLKTFPNLTILNFLYYGFVKGIKMIRPFYYIKYNKSEAKKMVSREYGWQDYGEHHHESIFTRFVIAYWLKNKFNIDKRKVTFSALIRSNEMNREEALQKLSQPPYDIKKMEEDKEYVVKKLGLTMEEFERIMKSPNKSSLEYPSYYPLYTRLEKIAQFVFRFILPWKPMMFYKLENNNGKIQ